MFYVAHRFATKPECLVYFVAFLFLSTVSFSQLRALVARAAILCIMAFPVSVMKLCYTLFVLKNENLKYIIIFGAVLFCRHRLRRFSRNTLTRPCALTFLKL